MPSSVQWLWHAHLSVLGHVCHSFPELAPVPSLSQAVLLIPAAITMAGSQMPPSLFLHETSREIDVGYTRGVLLVFVHVRLPRFCMHNAPWGGLGTRLAAAACQLTSLHCLFLVHVCLQFSLVLSVLCHSRLC